MPVNESKADWVLNLLTVYILNPRKKVTTRIWIYSTDNFTKLTN
jgi:hypothetical protein